MEVAWNVTIANNATSNKIPLCFKYFGKSQNKTLCIVCKLEED